MIFRPLVTPLWIQAMLIFSKLRNCSRVSWTERIAASGHVLQRKKKQKQKQNRTEHRKTQDVDTALVVSPKCLEDVAVQFYLKRQHQRLVSSQTIHCSHLAAAESDQQDCNTTNTVLKHTETFLLLLYLCVWNMFTQAALHLFLYRWGSLYTATLT